MRSPSTNEVAFGRRCGVHGSSVGHGWGGRKEACRSRNNNTFAGLALRWQERSRLRQRPSARPRLRDAAAGADELATSLPPRRRGRIRVALLRRRALIEPPVGRAAGCSMATSGAELARLEWIADHNADTDDIRDGRRPVLRNGWCAQHLFYTAGSLYARAPQSS